MTSRSPLFVVALAFCGCRAAVPADEPAADPDTAVGTPATPDAGVSRDASSGPDASRGPDTKKSDSRASEPPPDAFFGMSRCRRDNSILCEDFENGAIDPNVWEWRHETATGKVETTRAARGHYAFHVNIANKNANPWNYGVITTKMTFPVARNRLFIRMFMYLDVNTPNRHMHFLTAMSTERAPDGGEWSYRLGMAEGTSKIGGARMTLVEYFDHQQGYGPTLFGPPNDLAPIGEWACWEWELRGTTNELYLSINERSISSMTISAEKMWLAPNRVALDFGANTGHIESLAATGYDVWIDEILISNSPIGCTL